MRNDTFNLEEQQRRVLQEYIFNLEDIKEGLENMSSVPGRFERVNCGQDFTVVVDYAHTPDALLNVLALLSQASSQPLSGSARGPRVHGERTPQPCALTLQD